SSPLEIGLVIPVRRKGMQEWAAGNLIRPEPAGNIPAHEKAESMAGERLLPPHPGPLPWGEGERIGTLEKCDCFRITPALRLALPLPEGEGRGEGEGDVHIFLNRHGSIGR